MSMADNIMEQGIDRLTDAVLDAWKRFGKLRGDEPSVHERTMARVAAEVLWASAVIAKMKP